MGCSPTREQASTILMIHNKKANRISSVNELRIDATAFVCQGSGTLEENYFLHCDISSSIFGVVRKAIHKETNQIRAIKSITKSQNLQNSINIDKFFHEIEVLKKTDHPNIVKLFEFYEDSTNYHLVTEFISGGELFEFIVKNNSLAEVTAAHFMRQLLSAVSYCHSKKIVHRDLKPENLLLDSQDFTANLKVIDFGLSTILDTCDPVPQKFGSTYYIAPEVFEKKYTEKCDVWSCGVILFILLSGKPPFTGKNDKEIIDKIKHAKFNFVGSDWDQVSECAKRFISKMIEINPKVRISASEAIQDEWIFENTKRLSVQNESVYNNLRNFGVQQKMQAAVLAFISSQLRVKQDAKLLIENFKQIDINGDGKISEDELLEAYTEVFGREHANEQVRYIMEKVDTNFSGFIDFSEFLVASSKLEDLLTNKYLVEAFNAFDKDGDGKINPNELKQVLGNNLNVDENVWSEMIAQVDQNKDGRIDFNEFKYMMKKCLRKQ